MTQSLFAFERKNNKDTGAKFTLSDLEEVATSIAKALWGKYRDVSGKLQNVPGYMTKVCYVPGLSDAAHLLLKTLVTRVANCLAHRKRDV